MSLDLDWRIAVQIEALEESSKTGTISVRDCELLKNLLKELRELSRAQCGCGQPLPTHLAKLGLTRHVCRCERAFRVVEGEFVAAGTALNPFIPYDAAERRR